MKNKEISLRRKLSNKLFMIGLIVLTLFLSINFVSSASFDNFKYQRERTFDGKEVVGNTLLEKYKPIEIKNMFGLGATLFEGYISQHTDVCGEKCSSTMEIKIGNKDVLIQDVVFKTLQEDDKWIEQNIRSYQFSYLGDVDDYKTECISLEEIITPNGTKYTPQECFQVKIGTHEGWINYNVGEVLDAGVYTIKLEAQKKPSRTVDWQIKTNGIWLNNWATWGNISEGDDAEVILNSPLDGAVNYNNLVTFNASVNITGGATLVNMSLWTNETGDWGLRNTTITGTNLYLAMSAGRSNESYSTYGGFILIAPNGTMYYINMGNTGTIPTSRWGWGAINTPLEYYTDLDTLEINQQGTWNISHVRYGSDNVANTATLYSSNYSTDNVTFTSLGTSASTTSEPWINITTNTRVFANDTTWQRTITDGIIWNVQACDSDGDCGVAPNNYTLLIDVTALTITLQNPTGTLNYGAVGQSETLNVTFTDTNLDKCWYNYNGTNVSIAGCVSGVKNSTTFTLVSGDTDIIIFANDTSGNLNTTTYSWDYKLFQTAEYFNPSTISGAINPFNITFESNSQITSASLNYNETNYLGSISSSGTNYTLSKNQIAPSLDTATNISFFWVITRADSFEYNTTAQNQSVNPIVINGTCGAGMYVIRNFTLVDEITQTKINETLQNSFIKVDLSLYTTTRATRVSQFYGNFTKTNPTAVCIDNNLSGGEVYSLDIQVQYGAGEYSTELYHIEDYTLNSNTLNINTTLYDLDTTNAQNFKITVRDTSYLPIDGALIQIERKYIEDGVFKISEIPKTDIKGTTSASLEVNDAIYNFYVYEDGVLIIEETNKLAICQTPLISTCEIELDDFTTGIDVPNYEEGDDFEFTLDYNKTSKIITSIFSIPSGEPALVKLEVIREDTLGTVISSDTLTSASGTLSVTIPSSFGNSTVMAKVYKKGIEQGRGQIRINETSSDIFEGIVIILSVLVMLTLIGMAISNNPIISAVFLFVGVLLLYGINLVEHTGFVGATATILFLGIAVMLIIIKAGRRT